MEINIINKLEIKYFYNKMLDITLSKNLYINNINNLYNYLMLLFVKYLIYT